MKHRFSAIHFLVVCGFMFFATSLLVSPGYAAPANQQAAPSPVYVDGLSAGWENWSYGAVTIDLANTSPVHAGSASAAVTYTGGWSAFQIGYHSTTLDVSAYDTFRFWVHGGATGGQSVHLDITDQNGSPVVAHDFTIPANTWTQIDVSMLSWTPPRQNFSIVWFNNTTGAQATFYLDDVSFIDTDATPPPTPLPSDGPNLSVDATASRHPISPYIYGMNFADEAVANAVRLPVDRWGGNATTRYNWQTNVTNRASDYFFINVQGAGPRSETDLFVEQDRRTNTKTMLTASLIGWTPRDGTSCAYDTLHYPAATYPQTGYLNWQGQDCGTGSLTAGGWVPGFHPEYTSTAIDQTFAASWIADMVRPEKFGNAEQGGVLFYSFDNEVGLWDYTHHDVHPNPVTYDEIRDRTYLYGAAIKAADPTALTLGPVEDGWCRWFFSAADNCYPWDPNGDYANHGSVDYVAWYLQQMQLYEQQNGVRILDYFDLHIYPQAGGVFSNTPGNVTTQQLRLRSTRQLWDPTYVDESWIGGSGWRGGTVQLIPRMKDWVNNNYPGTKLAITEYNWGAMQYMNGALAQADVLGIFGREGVDLATLWISWNDQLTLTSPATFAFRMYRNYDGSGAEFGDTSVSASSANQEQLAIYAAQRASDSALTLMIVNKTGQARNSAVSLANFQPGGPARVYHYGPANLGAIVRAPDLNVAASGFTTEFPANTITLVVIPATPTSINPQVSSIVRANANPTNAATVDFDVTFSEPVFGVDADDFSVTATGVSGATISGVSGSDASYTVTVNTGAADGTIRLDVPVTASIIGSLGAPLSGLPYTDGETYTVARNMLTVKSEALDDGWALESTELSGKGGSFNSSAKTFRLGDDAANKQYRAILSFDTSALPDTAVITKVTLKLKQSGAPIGTNPFTVLGALRVDIRQPYFGSSAALAESDFKSAAGKKNVGAIPNAPDSGWYSKSWTNGILDHINLTGTTQFRLRFATDDNNNNRADYMKFNSGDASAASRPQLLVEYYIP